LSATSVWIWRCKRSSSQSPRSLVVTVRSEDRACRHGRPLPHDVSVKYTQYTLVALFTTMRTSQLSITTDSRHSPSSDNHGLPGTSMLCVRLTGVAGYRAPPAVHRLVGSARHRAECLNRSRRSQRYVTVLQRLSWRPRRLLRQRRRVLLH